MSNSSSLPTSRGRKLWNMSDNVGTYFPDDDPVCFERQSIIKQLVFFGTTIIEKQFDCTLQL